MKNPTEENDIFVHLAKIYSSAHRKMYKGKPCPSFLRETFPEGITNGADWYPVTGGMQDWSYLQGGTYELTLEVGCFKYPKAEKLAEFWMDNREALIKYIEQVHTGVKGFVRSSIGTPIKNAAISINNIHHATYTSEAGDYFRLLLPGKYNITVSALNYEPQTEEITIPDSGSLVFSFNLMRNDPQHWSSAYDFRILDNIYRTRYHNNDEIAVTFNEYQRKYPTIAQFEDTSIEQYFHSFKVTKDIGQSEETKIHVLILSSLFESSPVGREIVMNLMRHVITAYSLKEPSMREVMENAVFHFVTVNVNFNRVHQQFFNNESICDPQISDELGDKLLSAESDAVKNSFYKLFEKDVMSMALTFTAGDDSDLPVLSEQEPAYAQLAKQSQSRFGAQNQLCPSNARRINENESVTKITNLLFNTFHLPLFSVNLGCCKMPMEAKIAEIWREKIEVLKNFVNLVRIGVKGFVQDTHGNPLRDARILLKATKRVYKVSKNLAFFHIILPSSGSFVIEIICENFTTKTVEVVAGAKISDLDVIQLAADPNAKVLKHNEVSGYVTDENGRPVESAEIGIKDNWRKRVYSNRMGQFDMTDIDANDVVLTVNAQGYRKIEKYVALKEDGVAKNVIFKLLPDEESDMGFRNLIFVFGICIAIIVLVVCSVMVALNGCESTCPCCAIFTRRNKNFLTETYKFSLLTRKTKKKTLFEDGDEYGDSEEEEELFSPDTLRRELA